MSKNTMDRMFERVGPRMKAFLERIAEGLGYGEVDEQTDEYGYYLFIDPPDGLDVSYTLADSFAYEDEEEPRGCNPMFDIVTVGGEILGSIAPHNYTPDVWVPFNRDTAQEEIERRMDIIEDEYEGIILVIQERHG